MLLLIKMISVVGEYFPYALILVSLFILSPFYVLVGVAINSFVIYVLKKIIKQKRPIPSLHSDYGMPSGHSQTATFLTTLIFFQNFRFFVISFFLCFVTFWQRIHYQHHYVSQVAVGSLLGILIALSYRQMAIKFNQSKTSIIFRNFQMS